MPHTMHSTNHKQGCHCEHCHHGGSFSKGLIWGAVIGGILGLLYAPDKGEKTRVKLKKMANDYKEKGQEKAEVAKQKYHEYKEKAQPYIEKAQEKISDIKETIDENKGPIMDKFEDIRDSIDDQAKGFKKKYFKGLRKR